MLLHRHRQAFTHSSSKEIRHKRRRSSVNRDVLLHLEWDPLILSGLTEGMSEKEDVIHTNSQSKKGENLQKATNTYTTA